MVCLIIKVLYEEVVEVEERLVLHNEKVNILFFLKYRCFNNKVCPYVCLDRFRMKVE